jgi:hypothetical protein
MSQKDFDSMLNDAVSEALSQLGETVKQTLYYYLEKNFNLRSDDLTRNPREFSSAMSALLGPGADPLEGTILRGLSTRIDIRITVEPTSRDDRFADFIKQAAELYQSSSRNRMSVPP